MTSTLETLLAKPTAPALPARRIDPDKQFTNQLELAGDEATATVRAPIGQDTEGASRDLLTRKNLDPNEWVVTSYRSSEWTQPNGETGVSDRYTFARRGSRSAALHGGDRGSLSDAGEELLAALRPHRGKSVRAQGDHTFIVALGDMQFGKIDGDGAAGAVERAVRYVDGAADLLVGLARRFDIGHVHIAWLGDHVEGFVSQGGANAWRTPLTLNEQIRLTRRVMAHGLRTFANTAERVSMVAVPGNHGEPQRFAGKGVTRYDDSHDTEALIAVSETAAAVPGLAHVEFYVPETDEVTVTLDCSGTTVGHVHGHQFRPGQHMKWWQGQSFGGSPLSGADLLLAGHLHHFHVDSSGPRVFLQVPAIESESTWWRHSTGEQGAPGAVALVVGNGQIGPMEVLR